MSLFLTILGAILLLVGLVGSILPALPGPIIAYLALRLLHRSSYGEFSRQFLLLFGILNIAIIVIDTLIPIRGTKRMGGSNAGNRGSTIWLIVATIILPVLGITIWPFGLLGLLIWPFAGAYIGERRDNRSHEKAMKAARWSFLGFLVGTWLKCILVLLMVYFFVQELVN